MTYYANTPVVRDAFTRSMVESFSDKDNIGVPQAFQSLFGNPANGGQTIYSPDKNTVEITIMRGNDRIAALVPRGGLPGFDASGSKLVDPKYSVFTRVYPLIEDESPIRSDKLLFAMPGETDESRMSREDRMAYLARELIREQQRRIGRTCEYLASQSIITGKMPVKAYGATAAGEIFDFLRPSAHTFAAAAEWGAAAGDPGANLVTASNYVRNDAHVEPDYAIMDAGSFAGLRDNENIQKLADIRRFEFVQLGSVAGLEAKYQRMVANGFTYVGRLLLSNGANLALFIYTEQYTNPSSAATLYLPLGYCVVGSTAARCDRYFGPPEALPMGPTAKAVYRELFGFNLDSPPVAPNAKPGNAFDPAMYFHDAYLDGKNKGVWIRSQAAPIYATVMTDAFSTITGCAS
jgi:hypothetical protein